jgi:hypothetical protein
MKLYAHRKTESCRWPTEEPVVITHGGAQAPKGMMFQVSPLASMLGAIFCPNLIASQAVDFGRPSSTGLHDYRRPCLHRLGKPSSRAL